MKKITVLLLIISITHFSYGQQTTKEAPKLKMDYLTKSKRQKTAAWVLFGTGTAMIITGTIIWINAAENNVNNANDPFSAAFAPYTTTDGTALTLAGLLVSAASIPFFIASGKNKKRAASISFKNEKASWPAKNNLTYQLLPSISLKLSL